VSDDWSTPPEIFDPLNAEFHFDLDAAASHENAKCLRFLSNALAMADWPGSAIWCNPPYGRMLAPFITKCAAEADKGKIVVALIPMRIRAAWWHEAIIGRAAEVRCVRKRIRFLRPDGTRPRYTGSCDSCIVVWRGTAKHTVLTSFVPLAPR
jgi:site-specific DNA-methyltransferase (adenine-specific)